MYSCIKRKLSQKKYNAADQEFKKAENILCKETYMNMKNYYLKKEFEEIFDYNLRTKDKLTRIAILFRNLQYQEYPMKKEIYEQIKKTGLKKIKKRKELKQKLKQDRIERHIIEQKELSRKIEKERIQFKIEQNKIKRAKEKDRIEQEFQCLLGANQFEKIKNVYGNDKEYSKKIIKQYITNEIQSLNHSGYNSDILTNFLYDNSKYSTEKEQTDFLKELNDLRKLFEEVRTLIKEKNHSKIDHLSQKQNILSFKAVKDYKKAV